MPPTQAPTWTIRLKYHKTIIIIDAKPPEPLTTIVSELLRALRETHKDGQLQTATGKVTIPANTNVIQLAKPIDSHDYRKGWNKIYAIGNNQDVDMDGDELNHARKKKRRDGTQSLKELGLRDGSVLAFRFSDQLPKDEDEALGLDESEDKWDVIVPSYDDALTSATA